MGTPMDTEDSHCRSPDGVNSSRIPPRDKDSGKRRRLNFACNYCRSRKTRCDEQQPSCHACIAAKIPCVTEDRRRPGKSIKRREAGKTSKSNCASSVSASPSESGTQSASEKLQESYTALVADVSPAQSQDPHQSQGSESSNTDAISNPLPIWRQSTGTTSFQILTDWLDLACFRLDIPYHFGECSLSHQGLPSSNPSLHAGFVTFRPRNAIHPLPESWSLQPLVNAYNQEVHQFYPVVRLDHAVAEAREISSPELGNAALQASDVIILKIRLLLSAGGCILQHVEWKTCMTETLCLARNAVGHLIGKPSMEALEVLFLFSVCLRLNDEITASWTTIALCLSIAHTLGVNGLRKAQGALIHPLKKEGWNSVWWALYSYEKLFSFQLGYPSRITDEKYDSFESQPLESGDPSTHELVKSMAKVFSKISHRCYRARKLEDEADRTTIEAAIRDKVNASGESFLMLTDWISGLPEHMRPTSDLVHLSEASNLSSFISLHYHNAIIMLNRNSLLISKDRLYRAAEITAKDAPWEYFIRNGQSMVANSARKIIHLLIDRDGAETQLLAPAYFPSLHAVYVLAVHVLKHPSSRVSNVDESLLISAANLVRCCCVGFEEADRLSNVLHGLLRVVRDAMGPVTAYSKTRPPVSTVNMGPPGPGPIATPLTHQQGAGAASMQTLGLSHLGFLETEPLNGEDILNSFSSQPSSVPIVPDEIGCDWPDLENLLQRIESDGPLYLPDEGMLMNL